MLKYLNRLLKPKPADPMNDRIKSVLNAIPIDFGLHRSARSFTARLIPRPPVRASLAIFDDVFPNPLSGFRAAELSCYLREFPEARLLSTFSTPLGPSSTFEAALRRFTSPELGPRVSRFALELALQADLAYTLFLNNAAGFLSYFEANGVPFAFTLYPGGGFMLENPESDEKLARVCRSLLFRHVIVTQPVTQEYLLRKGLVGPDRVTHVFGIVVPPLSSSLALRRGERDARRDVSALNVCFVAHKYSPRGRDKGYDLFVETARLVSQEFADARFHVVGGFDAADIDLGPLAERFTFHGPQPASFFAHFYGEMDMILAPNRANVLASGAFDGFPTGCCVDAGLAGVAVCSSDPLGQHGPFEDGRDLLIVEPDAALIYQRIHPWLSDRAALRRLGACGRKVFEGVYSFDAQMGPRLRVLRELLRQEQALLPRTPASV